MLNTVKGGKQSSWFNAMIQRLLLYEPVQNSSLVTSTLWSLIRVEKLRFESAKKPKGKDFEVIPN